MNSQERDELMFFLRELSTLREPVDTGARALILQAIAQNPDVAYRLVQQLMGLRMAVKAQAAAQASGQGANPQSPAGSTWGSGLLKTAVAAGLGAAAGTVLADQAMSWLESGLDLGE